MTGREKPAIAKETSNDITRYSAIPTIWNHLKLPKIIWKTIWKNTKYLKNPLHNLTRYAIILLDIKKLQEKGVIEKERIYASKPLIKYVDDGVSCCLWDMWSLW